MSPCRILCPEEKCQSWGPGRMASRWLTIRMVCLSQTTLGSWAFSLFFTIIAFFSAVIQGKVHRFDPPAPGYSCSLVIPIKGLFRQWKLFVKAFLQWVLNADALCPHRAGRLCPLTSLHHHTSPCNSGWVEIQVKAPENIVFSTLVDHVYAGKYNVSYVYDCQGQWSKHQKEQRRRTLLCSVLWQNHRCTVGSSVRIPSRFIIGLPIWACQCISFFPFRPNQQVTHTHRALSPATERFVLLTGTFWNVKTQPCGTDEWPHVWHFHGETAWCLLSQNPVVLPKSLPPRASVCCMFCRRGTIGTYIGFYLLQHLRDYLFLVSALHEWNLRAWPPSQRPPFPSLWCSELVCEGVGLWWWMLAFLSTAEQPAAVKILLNWLICSWAREYFSVWGLYG